MRELTFCLQPFERADTPQVNIKGKLEFSARIFKIVYLFSGQLHSIQIPPRTLEPKRQDELWTTTCFEFFLGVENSPNYWEFNLSPSGNWNVYRFENYRQGMAEEKAISSLPFAVGYPKYARSEMQEDAISLELEFDRGALLEGSESLEIAIAAVVQTRSGEISYWALKHCGPEADFHRRDSFALKLS